MWPVPILIGVIFAPESPWWLLRRGRNDDAKKALLRLTTQNDPSFNIDQTIAMMVYTNEIEKEISSGTTYWDCFKGVDLRRTEIACVVWAIQNLCGSPFMGYSTYFYLQAGLRAENAFDLSMAQYALGAMGTMGSWWLMTILGRRTLYIAGLCIMTILLLIIGFASFAPGADTAAKWAIGSMLLVFTFVYDITVGPVCYSLVAEISSTRLRSKTIVLARNVYNVVGIIDNIITPRQLNPSAWNWGPKAGFFWAGLCVLCVVWSFFRLPEPKGRTYGELDVLFERGVNARKFKDAVVDPFHDETLEVADSASPEKNDDDKGAFTTHISSV